MEPMEELMTLFGSTQASGVGGGQGALDDLRHRRLGGPGDGGYQGGAIAGPEQTIARLLPLLLGVPLTNFSGLPGGQDFSQMSMDLRNGVGGPNVAPGAPGGQSINQPTQGGPGSFFLGGGNGAAPGAPGGDQLTPGAGPKNLLGLLHGLGGGGGGRLGGKGGGF